MDYSRDAECGGIQNYNANAPPDVASSIEKEKDASFQHKGGGKATDPNPERTSYPSSLPLMGTWTWFFHSLQNHAVHGPQHTARVRCRVLFWMKGSVVESSSKADCGPSPEKRERERDYKMAHSWAVPSPQTSKPLSHMILGVLSVVFRSISTKSSSAWDDASTLGS